VLYNSTNADYIDHQVDFLCTMTINKEPRTFYSIPLKKKKKSFQNIAHTKFGLTA